MSQLFEAIVEAERLEKTTKEGLKLGTRAILDIDVDEADTVDRAFIALESATTLAVLSAAAEIRALRIAVTEGQILASQASA